MGEALADVIHPGCDKCHFRVQHPAAATVPGAKLCAEPNGCLEATGVPRLHAQSPSEL